MSERIELEDVDTDDEDMLVTENKLAREPPGYERSPSFRESTHHSFVDTNSNMDDAPATPGSLFIENVVKNLPSQSAEARDLHMEAAFNPNLSQSTDMVGVGKLRQQYASSRKKSRKSSVFFQQQTLRAVKVQAKPIGDKIVDAKKKRQSFNNVQSGISTWQYLVAIYSVRWKLFRERIWHALTDAQIWKGYIKDLEGKHGAAVGTFFRYLRWTFLLNLFVGLLYLGLATIPVGGSTRSSLFAFCCDCGCVCPFCLRLSLGLNLSVPSS
eukprot:m.131341 g.131341  ORF g.131341 m.131341 type:complete len:269 (-) comp13074_c0_seq3:1810-2616(-)